MVYLLCQHTAEDGAPMLERDRRMMRDRLEQRSFVVRERHVAVRNELAELIDRLRAMLVQGLGGGREVEASLEPVSLAGSRATALALVFSELLQNALEHGGGSVRIELARRNADVLLAIADEGVGTDAATVGTGLSIVRALVRDELQGSFHLRSDGGTRAEVVFPA